MSDLGSDVVNLVSHATQQRLQNLLEKVTVIAQQKNMNYKVLIPHQLTVQRSSKAGPWTK